ncbi:MAG: hypothetical protein OEW00_10980 [candidate division Zixibacteria bacterium]|nr:hypothetical protein [candidate division Zixibacteria bacterium]
MKKFLPLLLCLLLCLVAVTVTAEDEEQVKAVKAVDWNELAKFLPEAIEGMRTGKLEGGSLSIPDPDNPQQPFSYSSVERRFKAETKADESKSITVRIWDSGFNQLLMAPFMMAFEFDGPDGSVKTIEIKKQKAKLITNKDEGVLESCQVIVLVAERILVSVEGDELTTVEEIILLAEKIDYDKLAALVK